MSESDKNKTTNPTTPASSPPGSMSDAESLNWMRAAAEFHKAGNYHKALETALRLAEEPTRQSDYQFWHLLGQIHTSLGDFSQALTNHSTAIELLRQQGVPSTHAKSFQNTCLGYAVACMRYGYFPAGLPFWEAGRLGVSWAPWPGSVYWNPVTDPKPRNLLVGCEGGYGDSFQFMRWLPRLKSDLGVGKVGLMVWEPLAKFTDWQAMEVDTVYVIGRDHIGFGEWQYSTSIMSMPALFGIRGWEDIPKFQLPDKYEYDPVFKPDGGGRTRIGFCWRAEENTSPVRTKSLPFDVAVQLAEQLSFYGEVYSLSPERSDLYGRPSFSQPPQAKYEPQLMSDWAETRDYVLSMDAVVTVDTAVAHLTGLLGVPCLLLLPASSCWRWGLPGHTPTWYGQSMNYFRQAEPLEWDVGKIMDEFKSKVV